MIRRNETVFFGGRVLLVSAVLMAGVALFAVVQAAEEKAMPAADGASPQLLQRLKQLEARVAQLEQRAALQILPTQAHPQPHTALQWTAPPVPQGWIPREINGMRYYIAPIDKAAPVK